MTLLRTPDVITLTHPKKNVCKCIFVKRFKSFMIMILKYNWESSLPQKAKKSIDLFSFVTLQYDLRHGSFQLNFTLKPLIKQKNSKS